MDKKRNPYIPVFKGGHVVDVNPMPAGDIYDNRDIIYSADDIISDGVQYDLTDRNSIYSIEIPHFDLFPSSQIAQNLGVTGCLDYVLRMRSGRYWNDGKYGLSTTCLGQATKLMLYSDVGWPKKDYYRIVNELIDLGRLKKAKEWEEWINKHIPDDPSVSPIAESTYGPIIWATPNPARTSYYLIKKYFPDLAPKSMSGYMRMYNAKSKNYLKLIDVVTSEGLRLPETIGDLYELEESGDLSQV